VLRSFQIRGLSLAALARLACARAARLDRIRHIFLAICDHYEPSWQRPARSVETARVAQWVRDYPKLAGCHQDSRGRHPQYSFFYPQDEYDPQLVEPIAHLCRDGWGDMEVHLHHRNDTAEGMREKLLGFTQDLHNRHGMLRRDAQGRLSYGFIHGNWALNNSRPDGDWCGVNNETSVLLETGCYADFTMPSAPAHCQTTTMNSIYYATDGPGSPKSHDRGLAAAVQQTPPAESLLMIQGPLALDFSRRKWGLLPGIENGDLTGQMPPTLRRLALWLRAGVQVVGREDWLFIKLHTHGAQERNAAMLLGEPMRQFHRDLAKFALAQKSLNYHYVTAYEMAGLVHQAEQGQSQPDWDDLARWNCGSEVPGQDNAAQNQSGRGRSSV
jgi:hypothetical protein